MSPVNCSRLLKWIMTSVDHVTLDTKPYNFPSCNQKVVGLGTRLKAGTPFLVAKCLSAVRRISRLRCVRYFREDGAGGQRHGCAAVLALRCRTGE